MLLTPRDNILHYNSLCSHEELIAARFFYLECRRFIGWLAGISTLSINQCAAIVAALSPRAVWRQNQLDAIAICVDGGASAETSRKHGYQSLPRDLGRARDIANGAPIGDVLRGVKVNAFYRNMIEPEIDCGIPVDRHLCRALYGHHLSESDITLKLRGDGTRTAEAIISETATLLHLRPIELANRLWYVVRRLSHERGQHNFKFSALDWRPLYPGGDYHLSMRKRNKPSLNLLPGCSYRPWLEETPFSAPSYGNEFEDRGRVCVNIGRGHKYASGGRAWEYRYRLVIKYELERNLRRDEHVHHLTHNSSLDNPEQLELLLAESHGKYHSKVATLAGWRDDLGRFVEQADNISDRLAEVPF